uniref:Uncharacterized protein n=1 Tax=Anguilla anguilla TaxID=7936 RepID=A0A0E9XQK6_ANGAN
MLVTEIGLLPQQCNNFSHYWTDLEFNQHLSFILTNKQKHLHRFFPQTIWQVQRSLKLTCQTELD